MQRFALLLAVLLCCSGAASSDAPKRPRIFGIARVQILTSDISAARSYYSKVLDHSHDCNWCEDLPGRSFLVNLNQGFGLSPDSSPAPSNRIEEITFATDNVRELRRYLTEKKIQITEARKQNEPAGPFFSVIDPEGHRISFIQSLGVAVSKLGYPPDSAPPSNLRLIHAGFVVRDRAAEDQFYKEILGFHVYWHGGMKDDETNWVDMQVPDGSDWIEYMLNVPVNADHHTLGVMNHIALGVPDIHVAEQQLIKNGWKPGEKPKIGRDGKWQLNLYDPDDTRVEFMEFKPTEKPCCSEFTGPHPGPKQ
jgi:catechol 2,3-dioxygenase-like lactoylglutathione lyase family enzyme/predicted enzyme related to lactoylglutathione lyase